MSEYDYFDSDHKNHVHAIFLNMAKEISEVSPDPSTKVGAVLIYGGIVIGSGFNSFPKGCDHDHKIYEDRPRKYLRILHAEERAILNALKEKWNTKGSTLYVWPPALSPCCAMCARMIIEAEIELIVYGIEENEFSDRWKDSFNESHQLLNEAGITSVGVTKDWIERWMKPILDNKL